MVSTNSEGVRRGAWSKEEDLLLKKCIQTFGEGRWHLVPLRAGLNRCRKSCRLRWLNYLSPDIKRGYFTDDEIDLLKRIHKLVGNRWSLIAGRIPGRTANDVKNFWNTYIMRTKKQPVQKTKIIKPKPHNLVVPNKITAEQQSLQCCGNIETVPSPILTTGRSDVGDDCFNQITKHHGLSESSVDLWELLGFHVI